MPRAELAGSMSARLTAVRCPAVARSAAAPCTCNAAHAQAPPQRDSTSTSASLPSEPETSVPVTTVPKPFTEKTRSMGSRKWPEAFFSGTAAAARSSSAAQLRKALRRSTELTGTIGAPSRNEPAVNSSTSSRTSPRMSASTRSALVSAIMPLGMPSRRQMSKCSRVCGLMDSSAATTNSTRSMPPTPASMFFTNRSWPGTSTKPRRSAGRQLQVGEADVDGDAAAFLFFQAVGIDAREGLHQGGFAVVDVAGGPDDDVLHAARSHGTTRGARAQEPGTPVFRAGVSLVKVDVQVSEARPHRADLTAADFRVYDDGEPQQDRVLRP